MSDNIIQVNQEIIHTELKDLVRTSVEETLNAMLDAEADSAERCSLCKNRCRFAVIGLSYVHSLNRKCRPVPR